jgi:hypothetical protein
MKILTYATDINNYNLKSLQNKLPIYLIPNTLPWTNDFYAKVLGVSETIKDLSDEEVIIFCDAYDVLPVNSCNIFSLENAINQHFDLNKITFNAEINCYPDSSLVTKYPIYNSKWRYLNSGIYCGRVSLLKKLFNKVLHKIRGSDDQLQFSIAFIETPDLIALDYECKIFQTLFNGQIGGDMNMNDFVVEDSFIINKYFKTKPLLFHGNGKINMSKLIPFI